MTKQALKTLADRVEHRAAIRDRQAVQSAKSNDPDKEYEAMLRQDARTFRTFARNLRRGDMLKARRVLMYMDTEPRSALYFAWRAVGY